MQRVPHELGVLHEKRLIEPEVADEPGLLRLGVVLAEHDGDGVADEGEHGEGDEADDQDDGDGLEDAGEDEGEHLGLDGSEAEVRAWGAGALGFERGVWFRSDLVGAT